MGLDSSWQFLGGPGSWSYRLFDNRREKLNRRLIRILIHRIPLGKSARVLEGGSGPGYASSCFARQSGVRLSIASDKDPAALGEARRRDKTLPVVAADLYRLPFKTGAFDMVWNSSTLEHLERIETAFGEMCRVTRQGGWIFVGVPYRFGPLGFQPLIKNSLLGKWLGPVFGRRDLVRLAKTRGLNPQSLFTYFYGCFIGIIARKPEGKA